MRIAVIISIFTIVFFSSCQDSENENPAPLEIFNYYENYQIAGQLAELKPGNDLILHYYYSDPGELLAVDAGVVDNLYIQVPSSLRESLVFNLSDHNIPDLDILYTQSCFCVPIESVAIKSINLEGRNTGSEILIFGTVELAVNFDESTELYQYTKEFQFNGSAFLKSLPITD